MNRFSPVPVPPYYAVIFSSLRTPGDNGYATMAQEMDVMAAQQPGYIGIETARDSQGFGITVSYWADEDSVHNWKRIAEHQLAQKLGKTRWYQHYAVRVARVERAYEGPEGR